MKNPPVRAVVFGCSSTSLSPEETQFFQQVRPWGFILFSRNIQNQKQIRSLVQSLRNASHPLAPIFIDQEGGRVARLLPPLAQPLPPAAAYRSLASHNNHSPAIHAASLAAAHLAHDLLNLNINAVCAPVLDLPQPRSHNVVGDRAFSPQPHLAAQLASSFTLSLLNNGVIPVVKHAPGLGAAQHDPHDLLPVITRSLSQLRRHDLVPFHALSHSPVAMTAHALYPALDPSLPFTLSPLAVSAFRRLTQFQGLLLTDALEMKALPGTLQSRAKQAVKAGCDVLLHCSAILSDMKSVADAAPPLQGLALKRAHRALNSTNPSPPPRPQNSLPNSLFQKTPDNDPTQPTPLPRS